MFNDMIFTSKTIIAGILNLIPYGIFALAPAFFFTNLIANTWSRKNI